VVLRSVVNMAVMGLCGVGKARAWPGETGHLPDGTSARVGKPVERSDEESGWQRAVFQNLDTQLIRMVRPGVHGGTSSWVTVGLFRMNHAPTPAGEEAIRYRRSSEAGERE
jgi:hypothetical protein